MKNGECAPKDEQTDARTSSHRGKWKVESGKWKVESGRCSLKRTIKTERDLQYVLLSDQLDGPLDLSSRVSTGLLLQDSRQGAKATNCLRLCGLTYIRHLG